MAALVAVLGALIAAIGATGVVSPASLLRFVKSVWRQPMGLYLAVGIRLVLGVILILAAPSCRFPEAVRIIGVVSIVAAVLIPFIGFERISSLIRWGESRSLTALRVWCLVAIAFGVFLVYAGI